MPFKLEQAARTTAFQKNGAVNCLVHVLAKNINNIPSDSCETLRDQFNKYYGITLTSEKFKEAIAGIKNPVRREIILGPVLAEMVRHKEGLNSRQPITHEYIKDCANYFGIFLESYQAGAEKRDEMEKSQKEQREAIRAAYDHSGASPPKRVPVLKIRHDEEGGFQYEEDENEVEAHNLAYQRRFFYGDAEQIKKAVSKAWHERSNTNPFGFHRILKQYETEQLKDKQGSSTSSHRVREQGGFFEGLFGMFSGVFGGSGKLSAEGQGMLQSFITPFVGDEEGGLDFGFDQPSSGDIGFTGFTNLFKGIMSFGLKISEMIKGVVFAFNESVASKFRVPEEVGDKDADDEDTDELGSRFAELASAFAGGTAAVEDGASSPLTGSSSPIVSAFKSSTGGSTALSGATRAPSSVFDDPFAEEVEIEGEAEAAELRSAAASLD